MTPEPARTTAGRLLLVATVVVLVVAGVVLALVLSRGRHAVAGPGVGVLPTAPASVPRKTAPVHHARTAAHGVWPKGLSAWTVVVATLPKRGHPRAAVERLAQAAEAPGVSVEVLDSSSHPRLRSALWILFAGRYSTRAQALRIAERLQSAGQKHAVVERLTG